MRSFIDFFYSTQHFKAIIASLLLYPMSRGTCMPSSAAIVGWIGINGLVDLISIPGPKGYTPCTNSYTNTFGSRLLFSISALKG